MALKKTGFSQLLQKNAPTVGVMAIPPAAVMAIALLLSPGNKLSTVLGVGMVSAVSGAGAISVINRRRDIELEITKERLLSINNAQELEIKLPRLEQKVKDSESKDSELQKNIGQKQEDLNNQEKELRKVNGELAEVRATAPVQSICLIVSATGRLGITPPPVARTVAITTSNCSIEIGRAHV